MFEYSLIELVEDIRSDTEMDIGIGKFIPERTINIARDILFHAGLEILSVRGRRLACFLHHTKCPRLCPLLKRSLIPKVGQWSSTLWTSAIFAAAYKTLLGKVGHIASKDGMNTSNLTIHTCHLDAIFASSNERGHHLSHCFVKEMVVTTSGFTLDKLVLVEFFHGKIGK